MRLIAPSAEYMTSEVPASVARLVLRGFACGAVATLSLSIVTFKTRASVVVGRGAAKEFSFSPYAGEKIAFV
jgi:hypothetical protein